MRNDWLFKVFPWFFGFVFFLIVCYIGAFAVLAYFAIGEVNTAIQDGSGIKGILERIWCGNGGCK